MAAKRVKDDKSVFLDLFPSLRDEIIEGIKKEYPDYDQAGIDHLTRVLEYTCPGGKMNRGLSVLNSLRHLITDRELSDDEIQKANILGWCIEWLQAFFLVEDDIMDGSVTRRGNPCWFRVEGVGLTAINDGCLIDTAIYKLLKNHFKGSSYYVDLLELMHETTWQTELGQMMDLITAPEDKVDLSKFSISKYKCIVKYKTAFYSFYLPVAFAMLMAGKSSEEDFKIAKDILLDMGEFFQIQDDYLDCYGHPDVIGKIGTDIQDNKCGWLVVQALDRATPEQRAVLEAHYGKKDAECEKKIKELYVEMNIEQIYKDYEEKCYNELNEKINSNTGSLPKAIFTDFAKKIFKREK